MYNIREQRGKIVRIGGSCTFAEDYFDRFSLLRVINKSGQFNWCYCINERLYTRDTGGRETQHRELDVFVLMIRYIKIEGKPIKFQDSDFQISLIPN